MSTPKERNTEVLQASLNKFTFESSDAFSLMLKNTAELVEALVKTQDIEALQDELDEDIADAFAGITFVAHSSLQGPTYEYFLYSLLSISGLNPDQIQTVMALLQEYKILKDEINFEALQTKFEAEYEEQLEEQQEAEEKAAEEYRERSEEINRETLDDMKENAESLQDTIDEIRADQDAELESKAESEEKELKQKESDDVNENDEGKSAPASFSDGMFAPLSNAEKTLALHIPEITQIVDVARAQFRFAACLWNFAHGEGTPQAYYPGLKESRARRVFKAHFGSEEPNPSEVKMRTLDHALDEPAQFQVYPEPIISDDVNVALSRTLVRLTKDKEATPERYPDEWVEAQRLVNYFVPANSTSLRLRNLFEARKRLLFGMSKIQELHNAKARGKTITLSSSEKKDLAAALGTDTATITNAISGNNLSQLDKLAERLNQAYTHMSMSLLLRKSPELAQNVATLIEDGNTGGAIHVVQDAMALNVPIETAGELLNAHVAQQAANAPSILSIENDEQVVPQHPLSGG